VIGCSRFLPTNPSVLFDVEMPALEWPFIDRSIGTGNLKVGSRLIILSIISVTSLSIASMVDSKGTILRF
jgi:hypothetical protein